MQLELGSFFRKMCIYICVCISTSLLICTVGYCAYFNGGIQLVSNNGASGVIETQNPSVTNVSCAWAMTAQYGYSLRYAQVGWLKWAGYTSPKYFYEYSYDNSTWFRQELGNATPGSNNEFAVGCDSTTMYFKINNVSYGSVALSQIPFTRNQANLLAETIDTTDQCPGSIMNPVSIGSAKYKNTSNNWVTASCSIAPVSNYPTLSTMKNNIGSGTYSNWEIWDSRY